MNHKLGFYGLDENKNVVPIADEDLAARAHAWAIENRRVGEDVIGGKRVSTVFLCGPLPSFFETMVFSVGQWVEERCERYDTWAEAKAGHDAIVKELREAAPAEVAS